MTFLCRIASTTVVALALPLFGCVAIGVGIGATQPRHYYQDVTGVHGLPVIGDEVEVVWGEHETHGVYEGVVCTSQTSEEAPCARWAIKVVDPPSKPIFIPAEEITRVRRGRTGGSYAESGAIVGASIDGAVAVMLFACMVGPGQCPIR